MGKKKQQKSKNKKSTQDNKSSATTNSNDGFIKVDPQRVRFQHSKIRPHFSGCGRSVTSTLDSIRNGEITPDDIPPIQVIVGPDENDGKGPWYFSLNNRRLWVFKRCRDEGLLPNNVIRVRVRQPKSTGEFERYSIDNCAVEAKFMRERGPKKNTDNVKGKNDEAEKEGQPCNSIINTSVENLKIDQDDTTNAMEDAGIDETDNDAESKSTVENESENEEDDSNSATGDEVNFRSRNTNRFCFNDSSSDDESIDDD